MDAEDWLPWLGIGLLATFAVAIEAMFRSRRTADALRDLREKMYLLENRLLRFDEWMQAAGPAPAEQAARPRPIEAAAVPLTEPVAAPVVTAPVQAAPVTKDATAQAAPAQGTSAEAIPASAPACAMKKGHCDVSSIYISTAKTFGSWRIFPHR